MKIQRSSKLYFDKWLTQKKKDRISVILKEYAKICNWFIDNYDIKEKRKFDFLNKEIAAICKEETKTWLAYNMISNAISESYGMLRSYNAKKEKGLKCSKPVHYGKSITISQLCNVQFDNTKLKDFDFIVYLRCIGNKSFNMNIPLKKHRQFNKWNESGKRSKSITLTENYVQFSFEIETGKKKEDGNKLGADIGLNKLIATNEGNYYGLELKDKIKELHLKKQNSKAHKRKKIEIKEYINAELKKIPFETLRLLVCENLKNVKHKMKFKRRLNKNIRRFLSNWNYAYVLKRLQEFCEENRVSFRKVNPFMTSQTCSNCGFTEKKNRLSQNEFVCLNCGYSNNADINAAKNILNRFITGKYGSCFQT
jgi:transposase